MPTHMGQTEPPGVNGSDFSSSGSDAHSAIDKEETRCMPPVTIPQVDTERETEKKVSFK